MTMCADGLAKLIEECGEVIQVAAKLLAFPSGDHPDGAGNLHERLEDELGDLRAAIQFVIETHRLDGRQRVYARQVTKLDMFRRWHADPNN